MFKVFTRLSRMVRTLRTMVSDGLSFFASIWRRRSVLFRGREKKAMPTTPADRFVLLNGLELNEIERRASELLLHSRINYAYRREQEYLRSDNTWGAIHAGVLRTCPVAYFSAEFRLHESLPIYSGGLGVLAGDQHQKCVGSGHSARGGWTFLWPRLF